MKKSTHFTMTSNDFFALKEYKGQRLSSGDKIVYQVLCSHLYGKSYCYPSIKTIANESALAARSVQRSLTRLQTAGLITVMFRQENGSNKTNCYYVKNIIQDASAHSNTKKCQEGMTKCPTKKNKKTNTINDYSTISTKEPVESRTKKRVTEDVRFQVIENDKQLQKEMNPKAYWLVKKYFQTIFRTKDKNYVIDGTNVSASEVQKCLENLGYRDIVDITNKVSAMMKRESFTIQSEYGYFLKVFWTHHLGHNPTPNTKKNMFNQFPQRKYSTNQLSDLEHMLLSKAHI